MSDSFNLSGLDLSRFSATDIAQILSLRDCDQMFVLAAEGEYDGTKFSGRAIAANGPVREVSPLLGMLLEGNFGRILSSAKAQPIGAPQAPKPAIATAPQQPVAPAQPKSVPVRQYLPGLAELKCWSKDEANNRWYEVGTYPNTEDGIRQAQGNGWHRVQKISEPNSVMLVPGWYPTTSDERMLEDLPAKATPSVAPKGKPGGSASKLFAGRRKN